MISGASQYQSVALLLQKESLPVGKKWNGYDAT